MPRRQGLVFKRGISPRISWKSRAAEVVREGVVLSSFSTGQKLQSCINQPSIIDGTGDFPPIPSPVPSMIEGRLIDVFSIDCIDVCIPYFGSPGQVPTLEVVQGPMPNKFLPHELNDIDDAVLAVQVNFCNCGGIIIAVCISNKVADALSIVMFVTGWAASASEDRSLSCPEFDFAKLFQPRDIAGFRPGIGVNKGKDCGQRFVFDNLMVSALKDKYSDAIRALSHCRDFMWNRLGEVDIEASDFHGNQRGQWKGMARHGEEDMAKFDFVIISLVKDMPLTMKLQSYVK
ncbi:hypothetical protein RJ640_030764 [Escallonia rubra]|uniref:Uncharacterized protein n=1 Tax=Escallonia rubra TaxID=112253 RepID=A0AA88RE23_9ASTE|nr:hypothetical protein RJ640_030764 [Escallonia rubra]